MASRRLVHPKRGGAEEPCMTCGNPVAVPCAGVVHVGRNPLAASVRRHLPVLLLVHFANPSQDAVGRLPDAGTKSPLSPRVRGLKPRWQSVAIGLKRLSARNIWI